MKRIAVLFACAASLIGCQDYTHGRHPAPEPTFTNNVHPIPAATPTWNNVHPVTPPPDPVRLPFLPLQARP